jgi:DNA-binding beta-propeller fold protein YncE/mono/diheme cytochrome c family protein
VFKAFVRLERTKAVRTSVVFGSALFLAALAAACSKNHGPPATAAAADAGVETPIAPVAIERLASPAREGASLALGKLGAKKVAFIADEDTGTVRTIDLGEKREIGSVVLGGRPGQVLVMKSGELAVALRDDSSVALIEAHADGSLALGKKTTTASEPIALSVSPDDATLFVATGVSHSLQAFRIGDDGALGERTLDVDVAREPRAVSISADGKRAFVAHAAASKLEVVDVSSAKITSTDLGVPGAMPSGDLGMMRPMPMPMRRPPFPRAHVMIDAMIPIAASDLAPTQLAFNDCFDCDTSGFQDQSLPARFARQGYALARVVIHTNKDGDVETFIVPHTEMMTGDPMIISTGYGGGGIEGDSDEPAERFTMSMIDAVTGKRRLLARTGDARDKEGCHLPRGSATDGTGNVYVACFGSDSLMAFSIGEKSFETEVEPMPTDKVRFEVNKDGSVKAKPMKGPSTIKNYFLSMNEESAVTVPSGPSGVAIDAEDKRLVSFSQIDGAVSIVPLDAFGKDSKSKPETIKLLRSSGLSELATMGRKIFFSGGDARISKDGRACSSCHPDGRDDGLVWSTPDGPRQTIMLAGRVNRQGPFGWLGKHPTLQTHMQSTMKNLKGNGLDAHEQDALAAFLVTMKGPPAKWHALTEEESHGRDVFNSSDAQCSSCHSTTTGFTDHDTHDVRSATASDQEKSFLVPSLADVGASAPYFHDGRYATLEELVEKSPNGTPNGTTDAMGSTKQLNDADKKALVAYLRTL